MNTLILGSMTIIVAATLSCKSIDKSSVKNGDSLVSADKSSVKDGLDSMNFVEVVGQSFYMQETETTRGQWKAIMGSYPEENESNSSWKKCNNEEKVIKEDSHPVSCVSWNDANAFAKQVNDLAKKKKDQYEYRLPKEEEWYAAAGKIKDAALCRQKGTQSVLTLPQHSNLYGMVGNVWEWTSTTPKEQNSNAHIIRGGSWWVDSQGTKCSSDAKTYSYTTARTFNVGFRLVKVKK